MQVRKLQNEIKNGNLDQAFSNLYTNLSAAQSRYVDACEAFGDLFGFEREIGLYSAPGRTEVGGNHTDHQLGCVLAGSVDLDVIAVVSANQDHTVRIKSAGFEMDTIDLSELSPVDSEKEKAASLIRGVCSRVQELGYDIGGFDAYTTSNVLKGSGLSSSAAFEVLIGTILSHLFNDGRIDPITIAKIAQYAENVFFGKPCGLMDQMACSVGGFTSIDFGDKDNPIVEKVNFDLAASKHCLCIVNTGGNHADLTFEYAAVPGEMKAIAESFGKPVLRQVSTDMFFNKIADLRAQFGDRAVLRAIHFFGENQRALDEKEALKYGDFSGFLNLVKESGRSSYMKLQNVYSCINVKEQGLSVALAMTEMILGEQGAFRVHGGGFGGTIQAFVPMSMLDEYRERMEAVFGKGTCYVLNIRPVGGVCIVKE